MRALFDVSVLIALFQPDHIHHQRTHIWWELNQQFGWASCPISENGFVRIISQPKYPLPQTVSTAIKILTSAKRHTNHQFWSDDLSLLDERVFDSSAFTQHGQVTDSYLLALAIHNGGKLITIDQNIKTTPALKFTRDHLQIL